MKPTVNLTGTDGNVFSIIGKVSAELKRSGEHEKAKEFNERAFCCNNYNEVLRLVSDYVEVK